MAIIAALRPMEICPSPIIALKISASSTNEKATIGPSYE